MREKWSRGREEKQKHVLKFLELGSKGNIVI